MQAIQRVSSSCGLLLLTHVSGAARSSLPSAAHSRSVAVLTLRAKVVFGSLVTASVVVSS